MTTAVAALTLGGLGLAPASAEKLEEPPALQESESAAEQAEAAVEQSEYVEEQAEPETAQTEERPERPFTFKPRTALDEYPSYVRKIEHIRKVIAAVSGRVLKLLELPVRSHMRKEGLPPKRARIHEERVHLREVRMDLRAKKVAAREKAATRK